MMLIFFPMTEITQVKIKLKMRLVRSLHYFLSDAASWSHNLHCSTNDDDILSKKNGSPVRRACTIDDPIVTRNLSMDKFKVLRVRVGENVKI